ncbi:MAG: endonuclease/exonuclease/phosphatase family protein [Candidatus Omnitrophica bacterium]|nr:endonuclease/exonuclease/phosphatase family protein [Candidatus Omnitrophota bacterium]
MVPCILRNRNIRFLLARLVDGLLSLFILSVAVPFPIVLAGADFPGSASTTLRVVTYNVQFLPGIASAKNERPNPFYRAERIAEEVSRFDIVALQEVFHEEHRAALLKKLDELWNGQTNLVISPKPEDRYTSGGCLIATRLPILATDSMVYKHYSAIEKYGLRADGFAAKGVIHARIARDGASPDDFIDVFATHLEAREDDLRPLQYKEAADFIRAKSDPNKPTLLVGDFNTYGMPKYWEDPESQYSRLMSILDQVRPGGRFLDIWRELMGTSFGGTTEQDSTEKGKRIDYIFLSNPIPPAIGLKPISIEVNLYQDPKVVALSDHNAVIAEFDWPSEP